MTGDNKTCPRCRGIGTRINGVSMCPMCFGDKIVCGEEERPTSGPYAGRVLSCTRRVGHSDVPDDGGHEDDVISSAYTVTW